MKKLFWCCLSFALIASAIEPVFHCNFENTLRPLRGHGEATAENAPVYQPGLRGQALLVGTDEKGVRRGVSYPHEGNLDWEQGTISFWVKPVNWDGGDTGFFHMLFDARGGKNLFYIYKYHVGETLYFLRGELGFWLFAQYRPGEWKKGEWHHVVCSWDANQSVIYIDGFRVTTRKIYFPLKDIVPKKPFILGEQRASMGLKQGRLSLMDEFKIFNRMLTDGEVRKLFLADVPVTLPKNLLRLAPGKQSAHLTGWLVKGSDQLAVEQPDLAFGYDERMLYVTSPAGELQLVSPDGRKFIYPLKKGENAIALSASGLRPGAAGWTMELLSGNLEYGRTRLELSPDAAPIRIESLFDLHKNQQNVHIDAIPGLKAHWSRDTTQNYGFRRSSYDLNRTMKLQEPEIPDFQRISLTLTRGNDTVFRKDFSVRKNLKLSMMFCYTLIEKKQLHVALQGKATGSLRMVLVSPEGKITQTETKAIPADAPYFFDMNFAIKAAPGNYTIRMEYIEKNTVTVIGSQRLRIPPAHDPLVQPCEIPNRDKLPPGGWTPAKATKTGAIDIWNRTVQLGNGVLFSSLKSAGSELLAAPVELRLNGSVLRGTATTELLERNDLSARYRQIFRSPDLTSTVLLTVHFDGYMQICMTLEPRTAMQVRELSLVFPLAGERVKLLRDSSSLSKKAGLLKAAESVSLLPIPAFWVGDYRVGLNFTAENLVNWKYRSEAQHVTFRRDGNKVDMSLNLISAPFRLADKTEYNFGLTITPTKPLNRSLLRKRINRDWQMWFTPWRDFNVLSTDINPAPPYNGMDYFHRMRRRFPELFHYSAFNFMSPFAPEWTFYEEIWRQIKHNRTYGTWTGLHDGYCEGCINGESYRNYRLNNWKNFINTPNNPLLVKGTRNFYFDAPWEASCYNEKHGCKLWRDALGHERTHIVVNRFRDMAIDVYRMIKAQGPDAKISYHAEWAKLMPHQTFSDVLAGGEGQENEVASKGGYYDILTPAAFAASFSPYLYGAKTALIPQLYRGMVLNYPQKLKGYSPNKPEYRRAILHYIGLCALHDTDLWSDDDRSHEKTWHDAQDKLGWDEKTVFHPYYDENPAVQVVKPVSDRVLASAYTHSGRLMVAILNDTDKDEMVTVRLDLNKLGVRGGLAGRDVFDGGVTPETAPEITLPVGPRGFRLLLFL